MKKIFLSLIICVFTISINAEWNKCEILDGWINSDITYVNAGKYYVNQNTRLFGIWLQAQFNTASSQSKAVIEWKLKKRPSYCIVLVCANYNGDIGYKDVTFYDKLGNVILSESKTDYQIEWSTPIPDTWGENIQMVIAAHLEYYVQNR